MLNTVKSLHDLDAMPLRVVIRTATGEVFERDISGWKTTGTETPRALEEADFPARMLWSAAEDIKPDPEELEALTKLFSALSAQNAASAAAPSDVIVGEVVS